MRPQLATRADRGLTELARRLHVSTTLLRFLIVGGTGYLVFQLFFFLVYDSPLVWFLPAKDTRVNLLVFTDPDIRLLIASVAAVEVAIVFQFNAHERWTFRERPRRGPAITRFLRFNVSSAVSPIIIVLTTNTLTPMFGLPYVWNTVGTLLGFIWNWTVNTLIIWPHRRVAEAQDAAADYPPAPDPAGHDLRTS